MFPQLRSLYCPGHSMEHTHSPFYDSESGLHAYAIFGHRFEEESFQTRLPIAEYSWPSVELAIVWYIMQQLLCGLVYLHSSSVIHTALHPRKVTVDRATNGVQIADFANVRLVTKSARYGWAQEEARCRWEEEEFGKRLLYAEERVECRAFTAPEILLQASRFGSEVDVWSVGCIFAYMLRGEDLRDSTSEIRKYLYPGCGGVGSIMKQICEVFGPLTATQITKMRTVSSFLQGNERMDAILRDAWSTAA